MKVTDANSNHKASAEKMDKVEVDSTSDDEVLIATTRLAAVVVNMCREQKTQSEYYLDFVKVSAAHSLLSESLTSSRLNGTLRGFVDRS